MNSLAFVFSFVSFVARVRFRCVDTRLIKLYGKGKFIDPATTRYIAEIVVTCLRSISGDLLVLPCASV